MPKTNKYTPPKISTTGKKWFVWFRYLDESTGKMKLFIKKGGANYSDLKKSERLAELKGLQKAILYKLEVQSWNPITNTYSEPKRQETDLERMQRLGLNDAIQFALDKCEVSHKTKLDYRTAVRFFKHAAEKLELHMTPIVKIRRLHIRTIVEHIRTSRNWSNGAYNKNMGYIKAVIDRLVDWDILEINPAHNIKYLKTVESQKYLPISPEEKKVIAEYLAHNHYRFFIYLMVVYHTGIRPKEALSLKIRDLNIERMHFKMVPNAEEENTKTGKIRIVPINPHLATLINDLGLENYPPEFYIFGSSYYVGSGNGGKSGARGAAHPDYFKPSAVKVKRDTVTKLWNKIIKKKLGVEKYMYAMKHTGADDKILAGVPLDALRELYGHSSKFMTEKYARAVKEMYRRDIVELSPDFN